MTNFKECYFLKIFFGIRNLNHIEKHLVEVLHQELQLKDLSDKGCHGGFDFHWEGIGNIRKKCLIVSISVPQLHMGLRQSEVTAKFMLT